jgi:hypothetical protein
MINEQYSGLLVENLVIFANFATLRGHDQIDGARVVKKMGQECGDIFCTHEKKATDFRRC